MNRFSITTKGTEPHKDKILTHMPPCAFYDKKYLTAPSNKS